MTDISVLSKELKSRVEWQETPRLIENAEYADYVLHGIQQLFALTSRPGLYSESRLQRGLVGEPASYNDTFNVQETEYILICAQILFFKKVQGMTNSRVGYTTDAFSVTNADKPYLHLADTIRELEKERRTLHYKLPSSIP